MSSKLMRKGSLMRNDHESKKEWRGEMKGKDGEEGSIRMRVQYLVPEVKTCLATG